MPARKLDTDAPFTRRSTVIGKEKNMWPCVIGRNRLCYCFQLTIFADSKFKTKFGNFWAIFGTCYLTITIVNFRKLRMMPI